ncbi:MAG: hypothetical protein IJD20_05625 [Oscillospiraceae bacterium]|nr:hypothetical protein [Oscillospiraceae bacterium]MBR2365711.1 hypothetical protein [Oscillospiraceae bacterium]MBR3850241.1 hypothetical protein [Oscillospiraceae bacterium]
MTKSEYCQLYDQLLYGHDADLQIDGHRFFIEWNDSEIAVYQMHESSGTSIAVLRGENSGEIVNALFEYPLIDGKSLNQSYQQITILDIE